MLSMLGVIRSSLAGRSMMVLLASTPVIASVPTSKRPRSGRTLKVRRSVQERVAIDLATLPGGSALLLVGLRRSFTVGLYLSFLECRMRVAANGRPLGRGGVSRDKGFSPSTRVGWSRTGPAGALQK